MKPIFLVYTNHPMCSIDCADAVCEVLNSTGLYDAYMVGPDAHPALELTEQVLYNADCLVIPGGLGDADQFDQGLNKSYDLIRSYVSRGGKYLGICMGSYYAGSHYFNLLDGYDAVQYIKRKEATLNRDGPAIVDLLWRGKEKSVYFYDGAAFIPNKPSAKSTVLSTYKNGDIAAMVQKFKKGKVGVVGPHPEAPKWWFFSQKKVFSGWKYAVCQDLLLDIVEELLK